MYLPATLLELILLGQMSAGPGGADQVSAAAVRSIWDFVVKGGPMMIPIGLCSLAALTVVIERLLSLRRSNIIPPNFLQGLKKTLDDDGNDRREAIEYCRDDGSPIANLFAAGIKKLGEPTELLEKRIEEAGEREVFKLRKYLRLLSVIASIAPLMGLLGTIFGMIIAFQTVATSGEALGKAELLAKGIYQAMITTAAGLMLAIPVLVAYHFFSAKIERLINEMDRMTVDFVEDYVESRRPREVAAPGEPARAQARGSEAPHLRSKGAESDADEGSDGRVAAQATA